MLREVLKGARARAGLSAKELSLRVRAHPSYVSRIERGHRTVDVVEFLDLAEAAGTDPRELFAEFYARAKERGG